MSASAQSVCCSQGEEDMADLDGRVAVVTGAARGIGLGVAERLSAAGASVVVADIDGATAEKSAKTLNRRAFAVEHDVRDGESSKRLREKALNANGAMSAGVGLARSSRRWEIVVRFGTFRLSHAP